MSLVFSRLAEQDLTDILEYIAQDDPKAGTKWVKRLEEKCHFLANNPGIGMPRPDLGKGVRIFPVKSHVIIYRPAVKGIEIVRVLSGYRDFRRLFGDDVSDT